MILPVRCFTCNRVIANKWNAYERLVKEGMNKKDALTKIGIRMTCCRRMFLSHVNIIDDLLLYGDMPTHVGGAEKYDEE